MATAARIEAKAPKVVRVDERSQRRALGAGAGLLLLGLAMVGVGESDAGAGVTLVGLLVVIYGIHTFGRLGPDER